MKKFTYLCALLLSACLTSCGGEKGIQPAETPITYGAYNNDDDTRYTSYANLPLQGCFDVESVSATIVPDENNSDYSNIRATVKVKTIKELDNRGWDDCECKIELLDADEVVIAKANVFERDGLADLLNSSVGDVITISHVLSDKWSKAQAEEVLAKTKYIRLAGLRCAKEFSYN